MADEQTTQTTQEQGGAQTAGGDPNVSTPEPEAENKPEKPAEKTFTQAELNKIIAERQKRWEKKAADEKAEAERVAAMTADEKSKHEREKQEKALAEREAGAHRPRKGVPRGEERPRRSGRGCGHLRPRRYRNQRGGSRKGFHGRSQRGGSKEVSRSSPEKGRPRRKGPIP